MSATSAEAAVLRGKGRLFELEELIVEPPRPDEVLVRVVGTGVCHTDLLVRDQVLPPALPAVLGHEGSGVVESVGSAVRSVTAGDGVVLCPLSCGRCRNCQAAHPMQCASWGPLNLGGRRPDRSTAYRDHAGGELNGHFFGQSSFSTRVVVHERSVVKVPGDAPLELLGPLGCGLQAGAGTVLNVLKPAVGQSIVIFGTGPVGLAAIMAARLVGCSPIVAVDRYRGRLDLACELGATHVFQAGAGELTDSIRRIGGAGVDLAVDAVGLPETVNDALGALAMGGVLALAGSNGTGRPVSLDLTQLMGRSVHGVIEGDSVPALLITRLVELHRAGRFPLDKLVRTYGLANINEAVADSEAGRTVKPVLVNQ
jgi:aryl-alcohol dehydrogenase